MLQGKILRTPELLDKVVSSLSIQVSSLFATLASITLSGIARFRC